LILRRGSFQSPLTELAEPNRIKYLVELSTTSGPKGDGRALDYLREARSLCQYVSDEPDRHMRLEEVANAMAEYGFLHEALITVRPHHLDRYLGHLAEWAPVLERQMPGLSLQVLCVAPDALRRTTLRLSRRRPPRKFVAPHFAQIFFPRLRALGRTAFGPVDRLTVPSLPPVLRSPPTASHFGEKHPSQLRSG
jgi:hypothetical protein